MSREVAADEAPAGRGQLAPGQPGDQQDGVSAGSSAPSELASSTSGEPQDDRSRFLKQPKSACEAKATGRLAAQKSTRHSRAGPHKPAAGPEARMKSGGARRSSLGVAAAPLADRSTRLLVALFLVGLIVCVTSIACILLLPSLVSNQIAKKLVLKNNSMLLERWSKPNVPMYFKVWLYDVKNAQEILERRDTKPRVEEVGPFVFNLRRQKDVISFAGDNLYYTERKVFHFNRKLSCCAINTTVTIPNIPLVAVVDRALGYNLPLLGRFIPRLINRAIQSLREQLFVRKQVREILFDGYDVELLKMVSRIGSLVGLPQQSQKFALLKGRNDTWRPEQDGVWAINTGQRDRRQFGRVASWNSYKKLPFWNAAQCNVINGSDGTLFPPPIKRTEPLYIFNQELCRTVNLVFDGPSDVRSIQALRFVLNPMNFAHTMTAGQGAAAAPPPVSLPAAALSRLANAGQPQPAPQEAPRVRVNPLFQNPRPLQPVQAGRASGEPAAGEPPRPIHAQSQPTNQQAAAPVRRTRQARSAAVPGDASTLAARARPREAAEAEIRTHQEKLVQVAQEAQLAAERKSKLNPQTCFCDRKTTNLNGANVCEFDGLIDLSKCSKQAQVIFGSMPHFYNSDPRLLNQVAGLEPNASRHTTYLDIEPNTGLVLGGKRRVQLNVLIKHNNEIDGFENINDMLVPIVWFEESALIPEETAQKFRSMYVDKIRMINLILFSLLTASVALLIVDARLLVTTRRWREFKLMRLAGASPQDGSGPDGQFGFGPAKGGPKRAPSPRTDQLSMASAIATSLNRRQEQRKSGRLAAPLVVQLTGGGTTSGSPLHGSANSPLLQSGSSTASTSSPGDTPPSSPQDSPELRKWSAAGGRMLTRVHLNKQPPGAGADADAGGAANNEKSIITLGGGRTFH